MEELKKLTEKLEQKTRDCEDWSKMHSELLEFSVNQQTTIGELREDLKSLEENRHYFVRQNMEVKDIIRKQGDGKEIVINGVGIIKSISAFGDDIGYEVEFDITIQHSSPYGSKWKTDKNSFNIFHNEDKDNIINVF